MPGRVFIAADLPPRLRGLLADSTSAFLSAAPSWVAEKPVAAGLLHVTLAFLGDVPDPSMPDLLRRLACAAAAADPPTLRASGIRAVPSAAHASMVWATFDGDVDALAGLAARLHEAAGAPSPARAFRPHATLARARSPKRVPIRAMQAASTVLSGTRQTPDRAVSVRTVTVYSSTLGSAGPTYEALAVLDVGSGEARSSAD